MATLGRYSYEVVKLASASFGIIRVDSAYGKNDLLLNVLGSEGLAIDFADRLTRTETDYVP